MRIISREPIMTPAQARLLECTQPQPSHVKEVFCAGDGPVQFTTPEGKTLVTYIPGFIPIGVCGAAYQPILDMAHNPVAGGNRGSAAGVAMEPQILADGSRGKRLRVPELVDMSAQDRERLWGSYDNVLGSLDRRPDTPRCRETEYHAGHPLVVPCRPLFRAMGAAFAKYDPTPHEYQNMLAGWTRPEYLIPGTSSTTVTINRNYPTSYHQDSNDLPGGRGVLTVLKGGQYTGCLFVVVEYGIAFDIGTQDVLIADSHNLWHGNTPIVGEPGTYERLAVILYYRENMHRCLGVEGELRNQQTRKPGDPLYPKSL